MKNEVWTGSLENLLVSWAEKASGYAWLHQKSIIIYKKRNLMVSIPASIFSYIAGITILLFNDIFKDDAETPIIRAIIGIIGIIAGILSNFQEMFTFKEEAEKHRIANLRFLSFFREISCELSLEDKYRSSPVDYIIVKRFELDKILEQSPDIPVAIINKFNVTFKHLTIHKPDPVIGLQTIIPFGQNIEVYGNRLISLNDKIILLKYFSDWKIKTKFSKYKKYGADTNDHLIEISNSRNNSHKDSNNNNNNNNNNTNSNEFVYYNGLLSQQKKLLHNKNVVINKNPVIINTP